MRGLLADFRHAGKLYLKTPLASAFTLLALALAMAFVSAVLSLWNDLALQPHPGFEDAGRLVTVAMSNGDTMAGTSIALMEDISENVNLVEGVATDQRYYASVRIGTETVQAPAETVVKRYFPMLRPRMYLGRGFEPEDHDPAAEPVVVLGYEFWLRNFNGRKNVIGEQLPVEIGRPVFFVSAAQSSPPEAKVYQYRIVGVLAPGMKGTFQPATELWFPFEQLMPLSNRTPDDEAPSIADLYENSAGLTGVGRLAPGATVEALQAELDRRYTPEAYPLIESRSAAGMKLTAIAGVHLDLKARREGLRQIHLFLVATLLLALVAGCNASLFVLSRAPGRRRELAIRTALGATNARLGRQLVSEAMALVVPAVLMGFFVSLWLVVVLKDLSLFSTVRWRDVSPVDWRVLAMISTFALLLIAGVSLAPVLGLRTLNIGAAARTVTARAGWGQKLAGGFQLLAAAVLGSIAVAFALELVDYLRADTGFDMDNVVAVRSRSITALLGRITNLQTLQLREQRRREVIGGLPGIEDITFSNVVPGDPVSTSLRRPRSVLAPGSTLPGGEEQVDVSVIQSQPNFPEFLGLKLAFGRMFSDENPEGVLVNETAARLIWGRDDVVGEPLGLFASESQSGFEVIGVLKDVYFGHPRDGLLPTVYLSAGSDSGTMLLKTANSPAAIRRMLKDKIDAGEIEIQLDDIRSLRSVWRELFATDLTRIMLTGGAAVLTVLLAGVGAYGTQQYIVTAGRREYAIRAALGAGPAAIGRLVIGRGILMSLPALAFGLLLAYLTVALMREVYFADSTSPSLVVVISLLMLLVLVTAAVLGPARRARRTEPAPLLREE